MILDETYRDFIVPGPPHSLFTRDTSWDWRRHVVHLYSFSKSYCIPGYRLGAIAAAPALQQHILTVLDCLQICPPRLAQLALAPLLPSLRPFVRAQAVALQHRHALFRAHLPAPWRVAAQGGYFAFVQHPFRSLSAQHVCEVLAGEWGIVLLPAEFFGYTAEGGDASSEGRWVRFAMAHVSDDEVVMVCERLQEHLVASTWELD